MLDCLFPSHKCHVDCCPKTGKKGHFTRQKQFMVTLRWTQALFRDAIGETAFCEFPTRKKALENI